MALAYFSARGNRTGEAIVACRLAQVLIDQGRFEDAEPLIEQAEQVPFVGTLTCVLGAKAQVLAARGDRSAADLVSELVTMIKDMPFPYVAGDGYLDAALASASLGQIESAIQFGAEALRLATSTGNVARAKQVRRVLEKIRGLDASTATAQDRSVPAALRGRPEPGPEL